MAPIPIQLLSGQADAYLAALKAQAGAKTLAPPPAAYLVDPGGISGGLLRPGAIDQQQFKRYLAEAQKESATAVPSLPAAAPGSPTLSPARPGIPTLSPAQFAALGAVEEPGPDSRPYPFLHHPKPAQADAPATASTSAPVEPPPAAPEARPEARPGPAPAAAAPAPTAAAPSPAAAPQAGAERGPVPGSHRGADGVWELPRMPDKDEREMLRGQKWRIVENPDSQKLFLGPDGKFGWDDFLDLINPLQHIPLVDIAYRAITGDQIYGAARMVDFAFGPAAGVSTAVDLAFQSIGGRSMAETAVAALFGTGHEGADDAASVSTASANAEQIAAAGLVRRGSNK